MKPDPKIVLLTERCFNGDPFTTLVRETRGRETREIKPDPATTTPYSGRRP
jgi:hypothetical protein